MRLLTGALGALVLGGTAAIAVAAPGAEQGPSSSEPPYLVRSEPGVVTKSILATGDSVNLKPDGVTPYRMVGIPDGLGAFDNGDGTFTLLMNHEIASGGLTRAHGATGAFVSKWKIRKDNLQVLHGEDLIQEIATWNTGTSLYNDPVKGVTLSRLCSATLAPISASYNPTTGNGYNDHIFTDGEETGNEGRAFGHTMGGTSFELPAVGKMSFENVVPNGGTGDKTVAMELDDSTPGQVYAYAGDKLDSGNPVEKAGLNNGHLFGIKVSGYAAEDPTTGIPSGTKFTGVDFGDVRSNTGKSLDDDSNAADVTRFLRPEDGAWDPNDPSKFYFVTTNAINSPSRLWRLNFTDRANPGLGGTIDMLLDGTEGQKMLDNITVNDRDQVIMQEDVGNNARLGKIWLYDIATDSLAEVAAHDPDRSSRVRPTSSPRTRSRPASSRRNSWARVSTCSTCRRTTRTAVSWSRVGRLLQLQIPPGKEF